MVPLHPTGCLVSRSGGEKGLRGSGAGTLGVPLGGTRRVGGLEKEMAPHSSVLAGRRLLLGRKVMTNLDSIFKSRDITLPTKV